MTLETQTISSLFNPKKLAIAVTGDVHVGHHRTPTERILDALERAFPDTDETGKLDLIVINGDFFDMGLVMYSDLRSIIILFIVRFLQICKKRDIVLRVLEGTPSHDNKQSKIFAELNSAVGADCAYVDTLSIEYIERFNAHVLYVPDEWRATAEQTKQEVKELLSANGIQKVDYAFMHGYFDYQLPDISKDESHDIDFYESIVNYEIFISHVHIFSNRGKVYAPGSIERLCHGEEGDKGHVVRTEHGIKFVINDKAQKYVTVSCSGLSLEDAYSKISDVAARLPKGSHLRTAAEKGNPIITTLHLLKKEYPDITFSSPKIDGVEDKKTVMDPIYIKPIERIPTITRDNIFSYIEPRLKEKHPAMAEACVSLLKELVEDV